MGLSVLDLKNNKLKTLSPHIYHMKSLKTLDLTNNDLTDIPNCIGFMDSLVRLAVEGNILTRIRSDVRTQGSMEIKRFLKTRCTEEETQLYQARSASTTASADQLD